MLPDPADSAARAELLRLASARPRRYLAAVLAGIPDEALARALDADPDRVWRLRLCGYPRPGRFTTDVLRQAALVGADAPALEALLRRVGVRP